MVERSKRKFLVTITEVITNSATVEIEGRSEEDVRHRIEEQGEYEPDSLEPQTVEVMVGRIEELKS